MSSELLTSATCQRCTDPVALLGREWHHAGPSDHPVEVLVQIVQLEPA